MSLSTIRTPHSDDDHQIYVSSTGKIFLSSVPDGVFNRITSFTLYPSKGVREASLRDLFEQTEQSALGS